MKKVNVLDLDAVLNLQKEIHLFLKVNPNKPLIKIPGSELGLMQSVYSKYKTPIHYNGETVWLNDKQQQKLKQPAQNYGFRVQVQVDSSNAALSKIWLDQINEEPTILIYEEQPQVDLDNDTIKRSEQLLKTNKVNLLKTVRLVAGNQPYQASARFLLEMLIGYEIKNLEFSNIETSQFDYVTYWLQDQQKYQYMQTIEQLFQIVLRQTTDPKIKQGIVDKFRWSPEQFKLNLRLMQENLWEKSKKSQIQLKLPKIRENHIWSWGEFLSSNKSL